MTYVSESEVVVSWTTDSGVEVDGPLPVPSDGVYVVNSTENAADYMVTCKASGIFEGFNCL